MKIQAAFVVLLGLTIVAGCATESLGRVAPLVEVEQEVYDCDQLAFEYEKVSGFCGQVFDNGFDSDDCAKGMAIAFVPVVGIVHNAIQASSRTETIQAMKSGSIRSAQLLRTAEAKDCTLPPRTRCAPICRRGTTSSVLTMENGFCGLRCTVLNRKERQTYAELIPAD